MTKTYFNLQIPIGVMEIIFIDDSHLEIKFIDEKLDLRNGYWKKRKKNKLSLQIKPVFINGHNWSFLYILNKRLPVYENIMI